MTQTQLVEQANRFIEAGVIVRRGNRFFRTKKGQAMVGIKATVQALNQAIKLGELK